MENIGLQLVHNCSDHLGMDYWGPDCPGYTVTPSRTSTIRQQRSIWKEEFWSIQLLSRYSCGQTEQNHSIQISASRESEAVPQKVKQTGRQLRTDRLGGNVIHSR